MFLDVTSPPTVTFSDDRRCHWTMRSAIVGLMRLLPRPIRLGNNALLDEPLGLLVGERNVDAEELQELLDSAACPVAEYV